MRARVELRSDAGRFIARYRKTEGFTGDLMTMRKMVEALSPFDEAISASMAMLRSVHGVAANLAPFRGAEPDSGTVFEVGVAAALGIPFVGYGAVGVGANLSTAALLADNAEEALQVLAGLLRQ